MKIAFIPLLLISLLSNLNCQNSSISTADVLSKKINKLQELKYGSTNLPKECYQFDINLEDSTLIFRSPNKLIDESKHSSVEIRMVYIKDLHPKSSLAFNYEYEKECVLRFVPRKYEEKILAYSLSIEDFLRYGDAAPNKLAMRPFNFFGLIYDDCAFLEEISKVFEDFIHEMNPNIPEGEEPPNPRITRLVERALRQQAGNLISNLEKSNPNKLVLPSYSFDLDNPPLYGTEENLENSIASFESKIINLAKENKIKIQKDISGDLVINEEGNIVEVLMATVSIPLLSVDIAPNEMMRKQILASGKWIPAKHREKRVAVKVRFYLSKDKVNIN